MMNEQVFHDALEDYKKVFLSERWDKEKFKWEAVKCFQDNWNIEAEDFPLMLAKSFEKSGSLLNSNNNFPLGMLKEISKAYPEELRKLFAQLFNEDQSVVKRIEDFKKEIDELFKGMNKAEGKSHYQNDNAISIYLWLCFPDQYYIYKYKEVRNVNKLFEGNYQIVRGHTSENIQNFLELYNEIRNHLANDEELVNMLKIKVNQDENCYKDPSLNTLTIDFGFYASRILYGSKEETSVKHADEWEPLDYSTGISTEQWIELLKDLKDRKSDPITALLQLKNEGEATCKELSKKYGMKAGHYVGVFNSIDDYAIKKTNCPLYKNKDGIAVNWPILYYCKPSDSKDRGSWVMKLREEVSQALEYFSKESAPQETERNYWWLNTNPKIWSFDDVKVGETQSYTLYSESGHKRRIFQNFLDARPGDLVIGYASTPVKQICALAKIIAEQDGKELLFQKTESLVNPINLSDIKTIPELEKMEYLINPQGSLFKLTKAEYETLIEIIREENPVTKGENEAESYSKEQFLEEVYMPEERFNRLSAILQRKKNIILQGAPGVGKTFTAKRLAYAQMGKKDDERIEFVQFHQNYSYEDFVMGYKPDENGFSLQYGIFYKFCQKAANDMDHAYFFIIDEINRGNLSKIFGELLLLIEEGYRGTKATLAYNGMSFSVPKNLYIIGMMNTADRSLALIDYALRRRFSFFEMDPGFDSDGFIKYQTALKNDEFNELVEKIKKLNDEIRKDRTLGKGFCIGHSYLCGFAEVDSAQLKDIVDYDILPMLEEYWFDDEAKYQRWANELHGIFQ
jgi:5-methylcytosine-specific restriction protein B